MRIAFLLFALVLAVGACTPESAKIRPDDATANEKIRGPVYIDSASLAGPRLHVSGHKPTPCHELDWKITRTPDAIDVDLYTVVDPNVACVQVLKPFTVEIPIGEPQNRMVRLNGKVVQ